MPYAASHFTLSALPLRRCRVTFTRYYALFSRHFQHFAAANMPPYYAIRFRWLRFRRDIRRLPLLISIIFGATRYFCRRYAADDMPLMLLLMPLLSCLFDTFAADYICRDISLPLDDVDAIFADDYALFSFLLRFLHAPDIAHFHHFSPTFSPQQYERCHYISPMLRYFRLLRWWCHYFAIFHWCFRFITRFRFSLMLTLRDADAPCWCRLLDIVDALNILLLIIFCLLRFSYWYAATFAGCRAALMLICQMPWWGHAYAATLRHATRCWYLSAMTFILFAATFTPRFIIERDATLADDADGFAIDIISLRDIFTCRCAIFAPLTLHYADDAPCRCWYDAFIILFRCYAIDFCITPLFTRHYCATRWPCPLRAGCHAFIAKDRLLYDMMLFICSDTFSLCLMARCCWYLCWYVYRLFDYCCRRWCWCRHAIFLLLHFRCCITPLADAFFFRLFLCFWLFSLSFSSFVFKMLVIFAITFSFRRYIIDFAITPLILFTLHINIITFARPFLPPLPTLRHDIIIIFLFSYAIFWHYYAFITLFCFDKKRYAFITIIDIVWHYFHWDIIISLSLLFIISRHYFHFAISFHFYFIIYAYH